MDTLAMITAAPLSVELSGKNYQLSQLTLRDYGEIEATIRQQRCPAERIANPSVSAEEMAAWMLVPAGTAYVLWLALRPLQPAIPLSECQQLVAAESDPDDLSRILDAVSGLPSGNCHGQAGMSRTCRPWVN